MVFVSRRRIPSSSLSHYLRICSIPSSSLSHTTVSMATSSITNRGQDEEIAEQFCKQGRFVEAIEIFQKLLTKSSEGSLVPVMLSGRSTSAEDEDQNRPTEVLEAPVSAAPRKLLFSGEIRFHFKAFQPDVLQKITKKINKSRRVARVPIDAHLLSGPDVLLRGRELAIQKGVEENWATQKIKRWVVLFLCSCCAMPGRYSHSLRCSETAEGWQISVIHLQPPPEEVIKESSPFTRIRKILRVCAPSGFTLQEAM